MKIEIKLTLLEISDLVSEKYKAHVKTVCLMENNIVSFKAEQSLKEAKQW